MPSLTRSKFPPDSYRDSNFQFHSALNSQQFFTGAVVALHIIFFFLALQFKNIYLNDSVEYLQQSENLKQFSLYAGDLYEPVNPYLVSRRPPGYASFILVCKSVFNSGYFVLAMQCLIGIFNFILLAKLIKKFYPGFEKWWLMAALLLFFPTQFIYANMIMAEIIFQSAILLYIFFLIEFLNGNKIKTLWVAQVFISAALLIKPVMYLFWIVQLLLFIYLIIRKNQTWKLLLTLILPIAIVLSFSYRNYRETGYWHYSSVNNNYFLNYAARIILTDSNSVEYAEQRLEAISFKAGSAKNFSEYSKAVKHETFSIIFENKMLFLWLSLKKAVNFFIDNGRFDLICFFNGQPEETLEGWKYKLKHEGFSTAFTYLKQFNPFLLGYLLCIMAVNIFIAFCFLIFLFSKRFDPAFRIGIAAIVLYLVLLTGLASAARFRMAVYPVLLFTVPFGLQWIKENFSRKHAE